MNTRFITIAEVQSAYGFLASASSISEIPNDQMSLFSCVFPSYTSGAMYHDVPHEVGRTEYEWFNFAASPKSPSLMRPVSETSRLGGLMSYVLTPPAIGYAMNDVLRMEVLQSNEATRGNLADSVLIKSRIDADKGRQRATVAVLHYNLLLR